MHTISIPLGSQYSSSIPLGGKGSGNWRHKGRPGEVGGSLPGGGKGAAESEERARQLRGIKTKAFGNDPNQMYDFEFRVLSLDDLKASNTNSGAVNPDYDKELQPRDRSRAASQAQIDNMAENLSPDALLWEFHQLDKGPMIIGEDMMIESGNGRALALMRARDFYPEQYEEYQNALSAIVDDYGIDPGVLPDIEDPVLIRLRLSDVDRAAFSKECNAPVVLQMSPLEQAGVDSAKIKDTWLNTLVVQEGQSIDQALRTAANRSFVKKFMGEIGANARATLMRSDGSVNRMGLWRIKAALFSKVFPGEAGHRLAETFLESLDSNIKNFENAIGDIMPRLAQAESLIASGQRGSDLSLVTDFSKAIDMLARLKESEITVSQYIGQGSLWERETNPRQDRILSAFEGISRSRKQIRLSFGRYADAVIASPKTGQTTLFGGMALTPETLLKRMLEGLE